MNKERLIFITIGTVIGGISGFVIGYKLLEKKVQTEHEKKLQREVAQLKPEVTDQDNDTEKDISKESDSHDYSDEEDNQKYKDLIDNLDYEIIDDASDEDVESDDISDEEIEVTIKKKHQNPKVLGKTQLDADDPDLKYDSEELFYFMEDNVLTDADGQHVDEFNTIGNNLRRYGFFHGEGDLDTVWVRNYDYEVDYEIHRDVGSSSDMFGEE